MGQRENILIHITGPDSPGILAELTHLLNKWNISILDAQQTTSLKQLSLSLLLSIQRKNGIQILRDITMLVKDLKLSVDISILADKPWAKRNTPPTFTLTILSEKIEIYWFNRLIKVIAGSSMNIERMNQLAQGKLQCIELAISLGKLSAKKFHSIQYSLFKIAMENDFNLAIQPENLYRRSKRLIIMDMDSTLIRQEVVNELGEAVGAKDQITKITKQAMEGKLDFKRSLIKRTALLKGLSIKDLQKVKKRLKLTPGADVLISYLKKIGFKIGLISGGYSYFADFWHQKLNLDYSFANKLEIKDCRLTGKLEGEIIDKAAKARILKKITKQEGISIDQTVAIGDGANDVDMLAAAGLGIAFNAKPIVRKKAKAFLNLPSIDSVLFLLGVSQNELNDFKKKGTPL